MRGKIGVIRIGLTLAVCLSLLLALACSAWALTPFKITQYVTDQADLIPEEEQNQLGAVLSKYNQDTGNQLLVVTIPSLEDQELVSFTESLFQLNKPGQAGKDNGLILLVALKEHKIRIETGYGLEETVPDGRAGELIRSEIAPRFKAGDYAGGITAGMLNLIHYISPDYTADLDNPAPVSGGHSETSLPGAVFIFLFVAIIIVMNLFNSNRRYYGRGYSDTHYWGGGFGGGFGGGSSGGFGGGGGFSGGGGSFGGGGASGGW